MVERTSARLFYLVFSARPHILMWSPNESKPYFWIVQGHTTKTNGNFSLSVRYILHLNLLFFN